jgi:integrase
MELFRRFHTCFYAQQHTTESRFKLYFPPLLEVRPMELTRPVIMQWFHEIGRHSHTQANHALSLLRTMFTKATEWQLWDGDNPASRIRWYKKDTRARFVQPEEMPRLLESLALESLPVQAFFLLCLLCGCRGGEARAMKWADLNLVQGVWSKPTTKTGTSHQVPLPPALVAMLSSFPQTHEWVFGSPQRHGGPVKKSTSFHNWRRIRERAGLPDVTIHDLRRTCASFLAISGENIAVIAKVLNHTSFQNTQIYARLNMAPVKTALTKHADMLLGLGGAPLATPPIQAMVMPPTCGEEREEWPG